MYSWMGSGLLTNNDPTDWKKKRRMLTPAFHFDVLKQYVDIFTKNTLLLVEQWEKCVENGNDVVDVQGNSCSEFKCYGSHVTADMTYLSLDNIGECAFGVAFNAINERDSPFVKATLDARHCNGFILPCVFIGFSALFSLWRLCLDSTEVSS